MKFIKLKVKNTKNLNFLDLEEKLFLLEKIKSNLKEMRKKFDERQIENFPVENLTEIINLSYLIKKNSNIEIEKDFYDYFYKEKDIFSYFKKKYEELENESNKQKLKSENFQNFKNLLLNLKNDFFTNKN